MGMTPLGQSGPYRCVRTTLSGSLAMRNARFPPPGWDPGLPQSGLGGPESGPQCPGTARIFRGAPTKGSPDRQAQVGDHFGHPRDVQVEALNCEF